MGHIFSFFNAWFMENYYNEGVHVNFVVSGNCAALSLDQKKYYYG